MSFFFLEDGSSSLAPVQQNNNNNNSYIFTKKMNPSPYKGPLAGLTAELKERVNHDRYSAVSTPDTIEDKHPD